MVFAKLYIGDALEVMKRFKPDSIDMCMTSPPYWGLRDYGVKGQLGLEPTPDEYIQRLVAYFDELRRVLKPTGSFYLNLGDTYMRKNLQMIPARIALALQGKHWLLRNDIVWHKPNHMPASVKDRLTNTYEHLFHFVKTKRYYYDLNSIRIPHKTGPASFNYRVREAKHGRLGIVGVMSHSREMADYDDKGRRIRSLKTKGAYNTKFSRQCQASNLLARTAYARKVLGGDHETALNHPLGKNPGDVIPFESDWAAGRRYARMPAFPPQHKDKITSGYRGGKGVVGINPDMQNHPLGKNPGDVMVLSNRTKAHQLYLDTRGRIGHGHYRGGVFLGVRSHPLGKNPGDVVVFDESMKYKGKEQLRQDKNLGGKVGLAEFRDRCRADGIPEGHVFGKNPGDVMNLVSETRSKDKLLRQRRRDLAEMRSEGRIHWELHPSKDPKWFNPGGKNPTDFWEIRPKPFPGAHFAVYPETLCIAPIKSSCPPGGSVLDPFAGSGTTMKMALELGRNAIGIELNAKYAEIAQSRVHNVSVIRPL